MGFSRFCFLSSLLSVVWWFNAAVSDVSPHAAIGEDSHSQPLVVRAIHAERPVARPSEGPNGAVFMTLKNFQDFEDQLVAIKSDVCKFVEIHDHIQDGPYWRMRSVPFLVLPSLHKNGEPGTVSLASGGKHIMLMQLVRPLKIKDTFKIVLYFQKTPPLDVVVEVTRDVPVAQSAHTTPSK